MQDFLYVKRTYDKMNYQKIYNQIIAKRQNNIITKKDCYCEKHHIIPKSLNGTNDPSNIVNLTAKEHYIAHLLLVKIIELKCGKYSVEYNKMVKAVTYFKTCQSNSKLKSRSIINFNSRIYEKIRNEYSNIMKIEMSGKLVGSRNGMFGKKRTLEEKNKIRQTRLERGCGKGEKNSMFGKSCYYKMTYEQYVEWKTKIKTTFDSKKFKHIYNPTTMENKMVPENEIQFWIDKGFIVGQHNKSRKSTKGMKKVCLPIKNSKQVWIHPDELQQYLNNGYVLWKNRIK